MFIELHIIQNFAPANLNRDDTGSPKEAEFGGYRRARISSQAIKRAIRRESIFAQTTGVENGMRTKLMARELKKTLLASGKPEAEITPILEKLVTAYGVGLDKKGDGDKTNVLIFFSRAEIDTIASALLNDWDAALAAAGEKKSDLFDGIVKQLVKDTKDRTSAPDIALFGRMLAEKPELNLEAACQVAHAISTHAVRMEMDYYTAVDDLQQQEETGAGMIGFTGYNSACFYRYARIDINQLRKNLDHDEALIANTIRGFLLAAVRAIPTGKQNSFAAQNPPAFLLGVVRTDGMSWNLANAFEQPVPTPNAGGLVRLSVKKLDDFWGTLNKVYGENGLANVQALPILPELESALNHLKPHQANTLEDWTNTLTAAIANASPTN